MKESEFLAAQQQYEGQRKRFESIRVGDMVWEAASIGLDVDYHPAVVKEVNVRESYILVVDVSLSNTEQKYSHFLTESELARQRGMDQDVVDRAKIKYADIISKLK